MYGHVRVAAAGRLNDVWEGHSAVQLHRIQDHRFFGLLRDGAGWGDGAAAEQEEHTSECPQNRQGNFLLTQQNQSTARSHLIPYLQTSGLIFHALLTAGKCFRHYHLSGHHQTSVADAGLEVFLTLLMVSYGFDCQYVFS